MIELFILLAVLAFSIRPLGGYIARAMGGERTLLHFALHPVEKLAYRAAGVNAQGEMSWRGYALSLLLFNFLGFGLLFFLLLGQGVLPLNPQGYSGLSGDLAFNVAVSFVTNTNWQSYSGEAALSPLSQMVGLCVQNFLSAATGIAVAVALFRGFSRKQQGTIGNFWVDMTRATLYVLLPLSLLLAVVLASQGVVQSFSHYATATTLEGAEQVIAVGPAASQVAIKQVGSNGGGFFGANSAHPLENPTVLSNFLQMLCILLIPATMIYTFGVMVGDRRQGVALLAAVSLVFGAALWGAEYFESQPNPMLDGLGIHAGDGNMEGKETRIGITNSAFWAVATTATSNGSVNSMHDSYMPLSGLMLLMLIQVGGVVFGGVGTGIYSMLIFVIITVFIGGLMTGRTPEYLGKKIGPFEVKMASLAILVPCALTLAGTSIALMTDAGRAGIFNPGEHGFTEVLYALASAANNNGSAFAGLNANSVFYNTLLGVVMFLGRFFIIIPVLALAGSLALRNTVPPSAGTMPTHTPLFAGMLIGTIVLVEVLTYIPALALGPIVEHLHLMGM